MYLVAMRQVMRVLRVLTTILDIGAVIVSFSVRFASAYATFLASRVSGMTCLMRVALVTSMGDIDSLVRKVIGVRIVMPGVRGKFSAIIVTTASTVATWCLRKCGEGRVLHANLVSSELKVQTVSKILAVEAVRRLRVNVMAIILKELKTFLTNMNVKNSRGTLGRRMVGWLACCEALRGPGLACCRGISNFALSRMSII